MLAMMGSPLFALLIGSCGGNRAEEPLPNVYISVNNANQNSKVITSDIQTKAAVASASKRLNIKGSQNNGQVSFFCPPASSDATHEKAVTEAARIALTRLLADRQGVTAEQAERAALSLLGDTNVNISFMDTTTSTDGHALAALLCNNQATAAFLYPFSAEQISNQLEAAREAQPAAPAAECKAGAAADPVLVSATLGKIAPIRAGDTKTLPVTLFIRQGKTDLGLGNAKISIGAYNREGNAIDSISISLADNFNSINIEADESIKTNTTAVLWLSSEIGGKSQLVQLGSFDVLGRSTPPKNSNKNRNNPTITNDGAAPIPL